MQDPASLKVEGLEHYVAWIACSFLMLLANNAYLSLCTGIFEIRAPPVMWRFSDLRRWNIMFYSRSLQRSQ